MKQTPSSGNGLALGLMAAILCFGTGSAYFVLTSGASPAPAAPVVAPAALPQDAPSDTPAKAATPAVVSVPASAPTLAPAQPHPMAAAPAVPTKPATPVAKPVPPKAAASKLDVPAKLAAHKEPKPAQAPVGDTTDFTKTAPLSLGRGTSVRILDSAAPTAPVSSGIPPRGDAEAPKPGAAPANAPADGLKPALDLGKAAPESTRLNVDPPKPVVAKPLVEEKSKPVVVTTTDDKAWVKVDDQHTVIVTKGQSVPGLGAFRGSDGKNARFDSGTLPVTPTN